MSASAIEASAAGVPEYLSWDELQELPEEIAQDIELWDGHVVWTRRGPMPHQRFSRRMCAALELNARNAMRGFEGGGERPCWEVEVEENVFFTADKSSFLTPDFTVRRCLPRGARTNVADVILVGEVLSASDTPKRRGWKTARYAEAGIPWYWEVELDGDSWDISAVRVYRLVTVPADQAVKLLRPAIYGPAGEWEPGDDGIDFPEPFPLRITWDDLAF